LNKKSKLNVVRSVTSAVLILMATLAVLSTLTANIAHAQPYPNGAIYVDPPKITYDFSNGTVGTLFNVTVKVLNITDMKTWQVKMGYNETFINVTRWYEPTTDPTYVFYGKTTLPVPFPPAVRHEPGWAAVGSAMFPAPTVGNGFTGDGLLCILTFNITAIPPEGQNYTSTFRINYTSPQDTFWIKAGESAKRLFSEYTGGEYSFIPELAPLIMLATLMTATIIIVARARKHIPKP
jgi:hypothetical protein